jgi:Domain of unknown function (DUF4926)
MATIEQQEIGEIDVVAFTKAIDKDETLIRDPGEDRGIGQWPVGTKGTVVSDFGDHKMVEIVNDAGETLDLVTVPVEHLELVTKYSGAIKVNPPIRATRQKLRKPRRQTASPSSTS